MEFWNSDYFKDNFPEWVTFLSAEDSIENIRHEFLNRIDRFHFETYSETDGDLHIMDKIIVRDVSRAWKSLLNPRSENLSGFSVLKALCDESRGLSNPELTPAFWADIIHMFNAIDGKVKNNTEKAWKVSDTTDIHGRNAARIRSDEMDTIASSMQKQMGRFTDGLEADSILRRKKRKREVLSALSSKAGDWNNWKWHIRNIIRTADQMEKISPVTHDELERINTAVRESIPFGITPYYASLFDHDPESGRDRAVRAQVIPPSSYIESFHDSTTDFMLEADTSPIDLITRRYAQILILKPYNSCPQICVYCQRNWEIDKPMARGAMASRSKMDEAIEWIQNHDSITEVLITGGDPLVMTDSVIKRILDRVAAIPHVERIRIGTRTPVTLPMRFTRELCKILASYIVPGKREICVMTHIQHPYEVTPDLARAVSMLRRVGIPVYNQLVYTFHVSRRFEAASLRRLIRLCGVDPYYTFYPKGKDETRDYRVPVARLLQEQKEESRLLPGLARTDEAVFNLPGLGKNHLNAWQHRDLISIKPDGARVYEFHPWEKKITPRNTYVGTDIPIFDYLQRLEDIGEDISEYESIWYYY